MTVVLLTIIRHQSRRRAPDLSVYPLNLRRSLYPSRKINHLHLLQALEVALPAGGEVPGRVVAPLKSMDTPSAKRASLVASMYAQYLLKFIISIRRKKNLRNGIGQPEPVASASAASSNAKYNVLKWLLFWRNLFCQLPPLKHAVVLKSHSDEVSGISLFDSARYCLRLNFLNPLN